MMDLGTLLMLKSAAGGERYTTLEVSGNPVAFTSNVDRKLRKLRACFAPRQAAGSIPAPDNRIPVPGVSSVGIDHHSRNLIPFESVMEEGWTASSGGLEASYSHGVVRVEGKNETSGWINILNRPVAFINNPILLPPGTYAVADHLTVCIKPGSMQAGTQNKGWRFTIDSVFYVIGFYVAVNKGVTAGFDVPLMLVPGTAIPETYETCLSGRHVCDWGGSIGTIHKGSFDFATGTLIREAGSLSFTWGDCADKTDLGSHTRGRYPLAGGVENDSDALCDVALLSSGFDTDSTHFLVGRDAVYVFFPNGTPDDTEIHVVYTLAESERYALDPQPVVPYSGYNMLWNPDAGPEGFDIDIRYLYDGG